MKCLTGIKKKLEDNTMFYREPVKMNKDWSDMIGFFVRVISRAAAFCSL